MNTQPQRYQWAFTILEIITLSCLAFAHPLLAVLGEGPEFFVVRRSEPVDVILILTILILGIPAALLLVEGVFSLVNRKV